MSGLNQTKGESDSSWLRRERVLDRFDAAWQEQGKPRIQEFLPPPGDLHRVPLLHELIKIDLEYRWASGERARVEGYLSVFPELGTVADFPIDLIREEIEVRRYHKCKPTPEEIADRFPLHAAELADTAMPVGQASDDATRHTSRKQIARYELRELLGRGSFSSVYRAWDPELRREVAIKLTRPELTSAAGSHGRVRREAQSAARLRHPAIVPIYEVGQDGEQTFIVYEYVPGSTLARLLRDAEPTPREAAKLVALLAEALDYAHGCGIVHRDIKPANIMIETACAATNAADGGLTESTIPDHNTQVVQRPFSSLRPKLTDFGLALQTDAAATLTQHGDVLGTPAYMSPEQARGDGHNVDPRTDVYSLGVLLFELITGQLPFRGSGASTLHRVIHDEPPLPSQLRAGVPPDLETICLKAMAKERGRRYATAGAMADDLGRFLGHRPILARRTSMFGRLALWCRRRPAIASTIAIATLVTVTAAAASYWRVVQERDRAELLSATLAFDRAINHCDQGEVGIGMLWLARSLELAPRGATSLQAAIHANLGAWQHELTIPVQIIQQPRPVTALTFCQRGDGVAARFDDQRIQAWSIATGEPISGPLDDVTWAEDTPDLKQRFPHPGTVHAVAMNPNGELAITGGTDNTARLWNMRTGAAVGQPLQHRGSVLAVAFSADGRLALTGSLDRSARLWNVATGEPVSPPLRHAGRVMVVATSPDNRHVATACHDGTICIWTAGARPNGLVLEHDDRVWSAIFTSDGQRIMTASGDLDLPGTTQLWSATTGERLGKPMAQPSMIREIAMSGDAKVAVTGSWTPDAAVHFWDTDSQLPYGKSLKLPNGVTGVALRPDGRSLVTALISENYAQVWTLKTTEMGETTVGIVPVEQFQLRHDGPVRSIMFSRDGERIATGSYDGTVRQWNAATGQPIGEPLRHRGQVGAVALSPLSPRLLLAGTDEGQAQLWDTSSARPLGSPLQHNGTVRGVAFSPDGQLLATASWDKTARLWHAATCKPVGPAMRHAGEVESIAFSPDGTRLLTASWDKTARTWRVIPPIEADVSEVVPWVQALTGLTLDASETVEVLDVATWRSCRNRARPLLPH